METVCESKDVKTVNDFMKENNEMILNVRYLTEEIKNNIFGCSGEKREDNQNPTCMMQALDMQNYNLRRTLEDLNFIIRTLRPNN